MQVGAQLSDLKGLGVGGPGGPDGFGDAGGVLYGGVEHVGGRFGLGGYLRSLDGSGHFRETEKGKADSESGKDVGKDHVRLGRRIDQVNDGADYVGSIGGSVVGRRVPVCEEAVDGWKHRSNVSARSEWKDLTHCKCSTQHSASGPCCSH